MSKYYLTSQKCHLEQYFTCKGSVSDHSVVLYILFNSIAVGEVDRERIFSLEINILASRLRISDNPIPNGAKLIRYRCWRVRSIYKGVFLRFFECSSIPVFICPPVSSSTSDIVDTLESLCCELPWQLPNTNQRRS